MICEPPASEPGTRPPLRSAGRLRRLRRLRRDLAALGPTAPLRAAYEASKRAGGHDLVFGRLARSVERRRPEPRSIAISRLPPSVPPEAVERALAAAQAVVAGQVVIFGQSVELGPDPPWHALRAGADGTWPAEPWWRIDIRSPTRPADVKLTWELGRHRHLVLLARAAALRPGDDRYLEVLAGQLDSWLRANPPERGVHWYSNLEIALRALAWCEVLDLAGPLLPGDLRSRMEATLAHSARHLLADLPYTVSTMRNNHLLGDALGLEVLARRGYAGRAVARIGRRLFRAQLARHVRRDGSMVEDSLSYHRFVLEMLVARVRLGAADDETVEAMTVAARFLVRLGVLDGPVPQYGDWDEGRVLTATGPADDLRASVQTALACAGSGATPQTRAAHDEVAWYVGEGEPVDSGRAETDGHDIGGGLTRIRRASFTAWLKAGHGPSHGHADLCSTPVRYGDHWVVGDPGTGTYNGPIEERNRFRTSVAHSVLRLDGEDQLVPHRAFRWVHDPRGAIGPPLAQDDLVVAWGVHDAYRRIGAGRVARAVVVAPAGVLVADWVEHGTGRPWDLSLPLGPDIGFGGGWLNLPDGQRLALALPGPVTAHRAETRPFDAWWSDTYDQRRPAVRLAVQGTVTGPVWWWIGGAADEAPTAESSSVAAFGVVVSVRWRGPLAEIVVDDGEGRRSSFCELR